MTRLLKVQQLALDVEPAAVTTERSSGRDHAMAGDDDGDRIPIVGHAHGAEGLRMPDGARDVSITARLAVGNCEQRLPAGKLKLGAAKIERHRELAPLSSEVFVKFAKVRRQCLSGLAKLKFLGVQVHHARFKFEPKQAFSGSGKDERADG